MPTYEYGCEGCGHEWEVTQRITEPPIEVCPACSKSSAHRLISAGTNFILKGGGWYSDLYTSPKPSTGGKAESKAETGKAETGKADGKTEAKADSPSDKSDKATKSASTQTTTGT